MNGPEGKLAGRPKKLALTQRAPPGARSASMPTSAPAATASCTLSIEGTSPIGMMAAAAAGFIRSSMVVNGPALA